MVYKVDSDYDCGYHDPRPGSPDGSLQAPYKPRKRKCKVHSGFKSDWLSVREQVHSIAFLLPRARCDYFWSSCFVTPMSPC